MQPNQEDGLIGFYEKTTTEKLVSRLVYED